jgi:hypothetical protein
MKEKNIINYLQTLNKNKINEFLTTMITILVPSGRLHSIGEINIFKEYYKYLKPYYILSKEQQIELCFFLSLFLLTIDFTSFTLQLSENLIILRGNLNKNNIVTNIPENLKLYEKYKLIKDKNFSDIYSEESKLLLKTSILNKRKFDTLALFAHLFNHYKYEIQLNKAVKKPLIFLFLAFKGHIREYPQFKDTSEEIKLYIDIVLKQFLDY